MLSRKCFVPAVCILVAALTAFGPGCSHSPTRSSPTGEPVSQRAIDRDLMEVTVPQLEQFYAAHKYTVTEVVRWYMARTDKYNGIYRAVEYLDSPGALATAAQEDEEARTGGAGFVRGPLWGVPIVIKANTSIKGLITSDGWKGYTFQAMSLWLKRTRPSSQGCVLREP